jgi:hypothetical protein
MGKLVQICASYNDLFGLDEDGEVYQHNFNTKAWVKLALSQREDEGPGPGDDAARTGDRRARQQS